jgi:hypothetical protein
MMKRTLAAFAAAALVVVPTAASAQDATGQVTVVHGIPNETLGGDSNVDVYANGDYSAPLLGGDDDFVFEDVVGPVELPAGDYELEVYPDGADPESTDPALATDGPITLPGGANVSIVAHLTEGGDPTLSVFVNDTSQTAAGQARLTVRHTAAAPAVDILAGDTAVFEGLANPNEEVADVDAGDYPDVRINAAGTDTTALELGDVTLAEGTNTIVFAIGSLDDGNLTAAVQSIDGLHSAPSGVPSGSAGLADTGLPLWVTALMALGLGLLATPAVAAVRARRR